MQYKESGMRRSAEALMVVMVSSRDQETDQSGADDMLASRGSPCYGHQVANAFYKL